MKLRYIQILPILFLLVLITPKIMRLLSSEPIDEEKENRKLAEKPQIDFSHLDNYPRDYNAYFNDNFGFRKMGLKLFNRFNYFFLKKSPVPDKAILGKDYWIFKGADIDIYRGKERLSQNDLTLLENELNKRDNYLSEKDCQLMIVMIPMKKEIYSEYMPDDYYRLSTHTMSDQFIDMINDNTNIEILDLREKLRAAKEEYPILYHKHDNHWNDIGAHYTYQEIIRTLNQQHQLGASTKIEDYRMDTILWGAGSLAKVLGVEDVIHATRLNLVPLFNEKHHRLEAKYKAPERFVYPWAYERRYATVDTLKPRLMMVNDSFGEYLYPLLSEHFSYSLFLFDCWEYKLHVDKLEEEKPDVFIICMVESLIPNLLENLNREENKIKN